MTRGSKVEVTCRCGAKFQARVADRKRGWGKFCSKSCKASEQEGRTAQHRVNEYRREYGGTNISFNRYGEPDGNMDAHLFSNEEHDCNKY